MNPAFYVFVGIAILALVSLAISLKGLKMNTIFLVISLVLFILSGLGVNPIPHQESWAFASFVSSFLV